MSTQSAHSLLTSITTEVDTWSERLKGSRMKESLQATISLVTNFNSPIICSYLISERIKEFEMNTFTTLLKTVMEAAERMYKNILVGNLQRVLEEKSIVAEINFESAERERRIHQASLKLMEVQLARASREVDMKGAFEAVRSQHRQFLTPRKQEDLEEDIQLMKFFEGIRRYQDEEQELAKRSFQRLRIHKEKVVRNVQLMRGFKVSELKNVLERAVKRSKRTFFQHYHRTNQTVKLLSVLQQNWKEKASSCFRSIKRAGSRRNLLQMMEYASNVAYERDLRMLVGGLKQFRNRYQGLYKASQKIERVFRLKLMLAFRKVLQQSKGTAQRILKLANSFILGVTHYREGTLRRVIRMWHNKIGSPKKPFLKLFIRKMNEKMRFCINEFRMNMMEKRGAQLSYRMKGRILSAVVKHEKVVDLRRAFLCWNTRTNDELIRQKIVGVLLNARINPFTVYARLHNAIAARNQQKKVSSKMRFFLMIFLEKSNKFMKYTLREKFQVWRQKCAKKALVSRLVDSFERLEYFLSQLNMRQAFLQIVRLLNESRIKKRFFLIMFRNSFADVKKGFNRWKKLPDRKKLNRQAQLKKVVKGILKIIVDQKLMVWSRFMSEYEIAYNKKVALLTKSFGLDNNYMQKYLYRWRTFINYSRFQQKTKQEQKEAGAKRFVSLALQQRKQVLRKVVQSFKQGLNKKLLLTRYFRKMEQTANRNVSIMLSRMRSLLLTDRDKQIKALKLENVLTKVFKTLYKRPVEIMKNDWTDGQQKKLALTKRFVYKLSCRLSHSIELLQKNSNEQRLNQRNATMLSMFSRLNENFSGKCLLGMLSDSSIVKPKRKAVTKLVQAQTVFLSSVVQRWRKHNLDEKQLLQLKKIHLENLISISMTNRAQRLRQAITQCFSRGLLVKKVLNRMIKAQANDESKAFLLMKTLPIRPNQQKMALAHKFTNGLLRFYINSVSVTFKHFKLDSQEGEYSKRRCLTKMLEKVGDIRKRKLMQWRHLIQNHNRQLQCKLLMNTFLSLSNCMHTNLKLVLVSPAEWIVKEKAFLRLSKGLEIRKSDAFSIWRTASRNLTLSLSFDNEKRIILTKMLEESINSTHQKALREVIAKFYKNSRILKMQHNFFQRLMDTQFGKVIKGFQIWKNLPELKNRELIAKATRFQNGLERCLMNNLRLTFKQFSEAYEEGLLKKKQSIRTLIHKCCKGIARYFEGWKNDTRRDKLFHMCTRSERMFSVLNSTLVGGLQGMFDIGRRKLVALKLNRVVREKNDKSYFKIWRQQNQLYKQAEKFRLCHRIMSNIHEGIRKAASPLLRADHSKELLVKQGAVIRLVNSLAVKQRQAIEQFRRINKRDREDKTRGITNLCTARHALDRYSINQQLRHVIKQFQQNSSVKKMISRLYNILSQNSTVRVVEAFNTWKMLPDLKEVKRRQMMLRAVTRGLEIAMREIRSSFGVFKDNHRQGERHKRQAAIRLANSTVRKVNKIYSRWNEATRMHRTLTLCRKSEHFFQQLTQAATTNLKIILENPRELALKQKYLSRLFAVQQALMKDGFTRWLMNHRSEKLRSSIDNHKKTLMITTFNQLLDRRDVQECKRVVHQFYLNWKITQCQTNFIKKLLMTKGGRVVEAFRIWKQLPEPNQLEKVRKAQKLFFVLRSIANDSLMLAFRPIKEESEVAQLKKKRAILQLLQTTSSGIRKFYSKWLTLTKKHRLLTMCKLTHNFMQQLTHVTISNMRCFMESEHEIKLKEKCINRLVANTEGSIRRCLQQWLEICRIEKMQRGLENDKKKELIAMIENAIGNEHRNKLKEVIKLFHLNYSITKIGRNFFNKLLQTKSGMTVKAFEIWKSLPDKGLNVKKIKAIKFMRGLDIFYERPVRVSFEAFKQYRLLGENRQKQCINKLLKKCMSYEQRKYLHWKTLTKELALLEKTKLLGSLFDTSFKLLSTSIYSNLIQPARQELLKKKNICRRMIISSVSVQGQALGRWVEAYRNDQAHSEEVRTTFKEKLINFIGVFALMHNSRAHFAVDQFRKNRLRVLNLIRYFERVNSCREYSVRTGFTKWLRIDDGGHQKLLKHKLSAELLRVLERLFNTRLAGFFTLVRENYKETLVLNKFISVERMMGNLQELCRSNLSTVLRNPRDSALTTKALNRIVENTNTRLRGCLMTWLAAVRQKHLAGILTQEKKKMMLQVLEKMLLQRESEMLPKVIRAFYKNYKINEVQRRVLKKILNCSAGKIAQYFLEWKNLPDVGEHVRRQRLSIFERGLDKFYRAKLKFTYEAFKAFILEGDNRKKHSVRKLVLTTMSDSNRMFGKWRQLTTETKILARAELLQNLFVCLNDTTRMNIQHAIERKGTDQKLQAVKKLMNNNTSILWQGFDIWRGWSLNLKNNERRELFNRMLEILSGRRCYTECFQILKKHREMNVLRNYINSLWRWKTSNIEAQYYTKFINIFRESEELLSLSRILNSKLSNIYGHVFTKLKSSARNSMDFRTMVVAKCLRKRLAGYFNEFKRNLKQSEVFYWKQQFQSSIKGIRVVNAFENSQRKFTCYIIKQWKEKARNKTSKIKASEKLAAITKAKLRECLTALQDSKRANKTALGLKKLEAVTNRGRDAAFKDIRAWAKLARLCELLDSFQQDTVNQIFRRLESRSTNRSKLSNCLQFIELAISAKRSDKLRKIINSFRCLNSRMTKVLNMERLLRRLQLQNLSILFNQLKQKLRNREILRKYRAVHLIGTLSDRTQTQTTHKYFLRWRQRKLQNPWTKKCMLYFATRSSINSSLAVSLWRLKHGKE